MGLVAAAPAGGEAAASESEPGELDGTLLMQLVRCAAGEPLRLTSTVLTVQRTIYIAGRKWVV